MIEGLILELKSWSKQKTFFTDEESVENMENFFILFPGLMAISFVR